MDRSKFMKQTEMKFMDHAVLYCHDFHIKDIKVRLNIESTFGYHKLKIASLKRTLYQRFNTAAEASLIYNTCSRTDSTIQWHQSHWITTGGQTEAATPEQYHTWNRCTSSTIFRVDILGSNPSGIFWACDQISPSYVEKFAPESPTPS